jgi:hypothetical protein
MDIKMNFKKYFYYVYQTLYYFFATRCDYVPIFGCRYNHRIFKCGLDSFGLLMVVPRDLPVGAPWHRALLLSRFHIAVGEANRCPGRCNVMFVS